MNTAILNHTYQLLVDQMQASQVNLKLCGSYAIYLSCARWQPYLTCGDLDFAARRKDKPVIEQFFTTLGFTKDKQFDMLPDSKRCIFFKGALQIDVFFDELDFNHRIGLTLPARVFVNKQDQGGVRRIDINAQMLPVTELLLQKLQVADAADKHLFQAWCLLADHNVLLEDGPTIDDAINTLMIDYYTSKDWGFFHTVTGNLKKIRQLDPDIDEATKQPILPVVRDKTDRLLGFLEHSKKSFVWKLRALLGDKKLWYNEVDDVMHDEGIFRILFATDIHGADSCFRMLLNTVRLAGYRPDVIIIGGDITGKDLVPIIQDPSGNLYHSTDSGNQVQLTTAELKPFEEKINNTGSYTWRCTEAEYRTLLSTPGMKDDLLTKLAEERIKQWLILAEDRLKDTGCVFLINSGNDDNFTIDPIITASGFATFTEGKVIDLPNGLALVSCGYANKTPFNAPRDVSEEALLERLELAIAPYQKSGRDMKECIFNFHCPPIHSSLDNATMLDKDLRPVITATGTAIQPVGSSAVRAVIEKYQPLLGLHGHIHESPNTAMIGPTLVINPGSEYVGGVLRFAVLEFEGKMLKTYKIEHSI